MTRWSAGIIRCEEDWNGSGDKAPGRSRGAAGGVAGPVGADLLLALGSVLVSVGVGWVYPPAGLVAAGVLLIAGGVLWARGGGGP